MILACSLDTSSGRMPGSPRMAFMHSTSRRDRRLSRARPRGGLRENESLDNPHGSRGPLTAEEPSALTPPSPKTLDTVPTNWHRAARQWGNQAPRPLVVICAKRYEEYRVTGLFVLAFLILIGPLAMLHGVDSRRPTDGWRGWPSSRRQQ